MGVNRVDLADGETLINLQGDTVEPKYLGKGITAHDASGEPIVGTRESSLIDSGQCGDDVYWELYKNGLLVISGSGDTYDYIGSSDASPFRNREDVIDIVIKKGVTSIGMELFHSCTNLKSVVIQEGLKDIEGYAFGYCSSLESITFPNSLTNILFGAFFGCTNLTTVLYNGSKEDWDKFSIDGSNSALNNATLYCEYDPNADTVDGWNVNVITDGSDPEDTTEPTLHFIFAVG